MSKTALAALTALFLATAGVAAAGTMDCCKDCKCCEEKTGADSHKDHHDEPKAPAPAPADAPKAPN